MDLAEFIKESKKLNILTNSLFVIYLDKMIFLCIFQKIKRTFLSNFYNKRISIL